LALFQAMQAEAGQTVAFAGQDYQDIDYTRQKI
jgi:hypothetical protein